MVCIHLTHSGYDDHADQASNYHHPIVSIAFLSVSYRPMLCVWGSHILSVILYIFHESWNFVSIATTRSMKCANDTIHKYSMLIFDYWCISSSHCLLHASFNLHVRYILRNVSKTKSILTFIVYAMWGIYHQVTQFYHHHKIENMRHLPLFRLETIVCAAALLCEYMDE